MTALSSVTLSSSFSASEVTQKSLSWIERLAYKILGTSPCSPLPLPRDIWITVFSFIDDPKTLGRCCQVSKLFYQILLNPNWSNAIWKNAFSSFQATIPYAIPPQKSYRDFFAAHFGLSYSLESGIKKIPETGKKFLYNDGSLLLFSNWLDQCQLIDLETGKIVHEFSFQHVRNSLKEKSNYVEKYLLKGSTIALLFADAAKTVLLYDYQKKRQITLLKNRSLFQTFPDMAFFFFELSETFFVLSSSSHAKIFNLKDRSEHIISFQTGIFSLCLFDSQLFFASLSCVCHYDINQRKNSVITISKLANVGKAFFAQSDLFLYTDYQTLTIWTIDWKQKKVTVLSEIQYDNPHYYLHDLFCDASKLLVSCNDTRLNQEHLYVYQMGSTPKLIKKQIFPKTSDHEEKKIISSLLIKENQIFASYPLEIYDLSQIFKPKLLKASEPFKETGMQLLLLSIIKIVTLIFKKIQEFFLFLFNMRILIKTVSKSHFLKDYVGDYKINIQN